LNFYIPKLQCEWGIIIDRSVGHERYLWLNGVSSVVKVRGRGVNPTCCRFAPLC